MDEIKNDIDIFNYRGDFIKDNKRLILIISLVVIMILLPRILKYLSSTIVNYKELLNVLKNE